MFRNRGSASPPEPRSLPKISSSISKSSSSESIVTSATSKICLEISRDSIAKRWGRRRYVMMSLFSIMLVAMYSFSATASATTRRDYDASHTVAPPIRGASTTHSIPPPLPKEKVSVILMNFSRPRMIKESSMMGTLLSHPNIDEILLLHANEKTAFEFVHDKVKNIDAAKHNNEMGLSLRFYFCRIARNDWILHLDDDMEFTTEALNELIVEYGRNPKRIVGKFGRDFKPGNSFNGYNSKNSHKNSEVVLTKLMLMERHTCSAFFDYSHLVWDDIVLHNGEGPLWNGEDIFMSLVANHVYQEERKRSTQFNNYAMDWLDVWQADDSLKDYGNGKLDISGGMNGIRFWSWSWWQSLMKRNRHFSYRGRLWQVAKDRLQELSSPASTQIKDMEQKQTFFINSKARLMN